MSRWPRIGKMVYQYLYYLIISLSGSLTINFIIMIKVENLSKIFRTKEIEIIILDPMLATGGTLSAAIGLLKAHGCR